MPRQAVVCSRLAFGQDQSAVTSSTTAPHVKNGGVLWSSTLQEQLFATCTLSAPTPKHIRIASSSAFSPRGDVIFAGEGQFPQFFFQALGLTDSGPRIGHADLANMLAKRVSKRTHTRTNDSISNKIGTKESRENRPFPTMLCSTSSLAILS
jgi:hypothetical protein